jgi:hypothetical protein
MPDPVLILTAQGVAAVVSALVSIACGWPWRGDRRSWIDAGWVVGIGAGFFTGCWVLGIRPHWPPREDLDRVLVWILPAIMVIELVALFPKVPRWLAWSIRLVAIASAARLLLQGSSYITDLAGPGTSEWSPGQTWSILGCLAALLAVVWIGLSVLERRAPGSSVPVSLAVASAASAVTVMLSGYATGGQIGLPLAAALVGATAAGLVLPQARGAAKPVGVAIVLLFSLLVIGRFFGELTSTHAVLLLCSPLLGWLLELPYLSRLPGWARGLGRVFLVSALAVVVLVQAQGAFNRNMQPPSGASSHEPTIDDYLNYGK